jgi:hypothetical protein
MKRTMILGTLAALLLTATAGFGADANTPASPSDSGSKVTLTWPEFIKITGYNPLKKGGQTLSIPWADVQKLLGVEVKGVGAGAIVDLPWQDFKALLDWSIQRQAGEAAPPPTDFIVTSSQYTGTLSGESASMVLTAKINILNKKGWKTIPLLPLTVALGQNTTLPKGVFLNASGGAYTLLTEEAGEIDVVIPFSVAVQTSGGTNTVSFARVLPSSGIVDLTVDQENVDVKVAGAQSLVSKPDGAKTKVAAALPMQAPMNISWERALPKVPVAPAKLYAESGTLVAVAEGMLLCQEVVNYNILHSPVRELGLQVPQGVSVLAVFGPNVQDWRVEKDGKMTVVLRQEVLGSYSLRISYEQASQAQANLPVIQARGVERERGFVGLVAVSNAEIAAGKVDGASEIDVRQLPADIVSMTNQPLLLGFRYLGGNFTIPLTIKRHEEVAVLATVVDSAAFTAMQLPDGRRMTKVTYAVRNNRNQFLRLKMPAGAETWSLSVAGNTASPAKDDKGNVLIPLIRSTRTSAELEAFPVEVVYVEAPAAAVPERGTLHVELPSCNVPSLHVMFSLYAPTEGSYTIGWGESGFSGPMTVVESFASMAAATGRRVVTINAEKDSQQMQQTMNVRVDAEARAAGAAPIRVTLPVNGKLFRLEKILVLPGDKLFFDLKYSGWKVAK